MNPAQSNLPRSSKADLRPVDQCQQCGRFVGRYPVGFYCDTHCRNCICSRCPGVDGPGVYAVRHD